MTVIEKIKKFGEDVLAIYKSYKEIIFILITLIAPGIYRLYTSDTFNFYIVLDICILIAWIFLFLKLSQKRLSPIINNSNSHFLLYKYRNRKKYMILSALFVVSIFIFSFFEIRSITVANRNKTLVLIIPFKNETDNSKEVFAAQLYGQLNELLTNDREIRVELLDTPISETQGGINSAKQIALRKKASILIWGWYSKTPTNVFLKTKFEILDSVMKDVRPDLEVDSVNKAFKIEKLNDFELQTQLTNSHSFLVFSCLGYLKFVKKNWVEAINYFNWALNIKSSNANLSTINSFKGYCLYGQKNLDSAIFCFKKSINYNYRYIPPYIGLGICYTKNNQFDLAIQCFDIALNYDPDDVNAYNNLGIVYFIKKNYDLAYQNFLHAYSIYPGDTVTLKNIAEFVELQNDIEKNVFINEKSRNFKGIYRALVQRSLYYYDSKEYGKALIDINACIKSAPDSAKLFVMRGNVEDDWKGDKHLALKDYNHALKLEPQNPDIYYERGIIYKGMGNLNLALKDYKKTISIYPMPEAFNNIGGIYMNRKQYKSAYKYFELAYKNSKPKDSSFYANNMRKAEFFGHFK